MKASIMCQLIPKEYFVAFIRLTWNNKSENARNVKLAKFVEKRLKATFGK